MATQAQLAQAQNMYVPADSGPMLWGPGDSYTFLVTGAQSGGAYFILEGMVPPGGCPPPHIHQREEECFYLLQGSLTMTLGDRQFQVIHLPGHSPGGIGLWEAPTGIFFSGDTIYDGPLIDDVVDDYVRSMERLRAIGLQAEAAKHRNAQIGGHEAANGCRLADREDEGADRDEGEAPGQAQSELAARLETYELAFRMQQHAPEAVDLSRENAPTLARYGLDQPPTEKFGRRCLMCARMRSVSLAIVAAAKVRHTP